MIDLRDEMETEIMFSELRCKKIIPSALAAYKVFLSQLIVKVGNTEDIDSGKLQPLFLGLHFCSCSLLYLKCA